jgi:HEAT repeat protein
MDESSQIYGMQQVLRWLKEDGVRALPALIESGMPKTDDIARLVADLGDEKTKVDASRRLVAIAQDVASPGWKKKKAPSVEAANKASGLEPTKDQFEAQLDQYQEEELLRVFQSMTKIGQTPIVDFLLQYAQNKDYPAKRRAAALAALEGHLDRKKPAHADAVLSLLSDDTTPDLLRDVAVKRVGELPREKVVEKLYTLFDNERWQIRWIAADLILKMSETKHVDEFMKKLGRAQGMAMSEPLVYGPTIGQMKGSPKPVEYIDKYAKEDQPVQARLTALGYYYKNGGAADIPKVEAYKNDTTKVPSCAESATDCEWECTIQVDKQPVAKEVSTVGDFVEYCIRPAMEARASEKKDEKKDKN